MAHNFPFLLMSKNSRQQVALGLESVSQTLCMDKAAPVTTNKQIPSLRVFTLNILNLSMRRECMSHMSAYNHTRPYTAPEQFSDSISLLNNLKTNTEIHHK